MKHLFLKARFSAIWLLLTRKYFMSITATADGSMQGRYNVNHKSFQLLIRTINPIYEQRDAEAQILAATKEILK